MTFTSIIALAAAVVLAGPALPAAPVQTATVPFVLDHNRLTVAVELRGADGTTRVARAWVDTGGTRLVLAEPLAKALGVDTSRLDQAADSAVDTRTPAPAVRVGGVALDTQDMVASVRAGRFAMPGVQADVVVPARCLRALHVVFDYPAARLTLAAPRTLKPQGSAVACRVNQATGLFMVEGTIDGQRVALGVDTGSAGTWVSETLVAGWLARHPDWPEAVGAAGSTNFFGFPLETRGRLLRLPALAIGPVSTTDVAVLGVTPGLFDWYSQKSAAAVAGFVGADLIARFRLEVDFPAQTCWWQPGPASPVRDLDIVGLTIAAGPDGSYVVAGVVSRAGQPVVAGVEVGDKLLRVGKLDVANARMGQVIQALRGRPGEKRVLVLERAGKQLTIEATVIRLP